MSKLNNSLAGVDQYSWQPMNNGQLARVKTYRSYQDVDIEFKDGTVVEHKSMSNFNRGMIDNPNFNKTSLVGRKVPQTCGQIAECIADRGCFDIDIKFEDGYVVRHWYRTAFVVGHVRNPNLDFCKKHLGDRKRMNCGYWCTITECKCYIDVTVTFDIDGTKVEHRQYSEFERGMILHPKLGKVWGRGDSIPQRILHHYVRMFYPNAAYSVRPPWLKMQGKRVGYELDIYIPEIRVAIEYDGATKYHKSFSSTNIGKNKAIEASDKIDKVFVVRDRDPKIVKFETPKYTNIRLTYSHNEYKYRDVFEAVKLILSDLGNDISSLTWDDDIVAKVYAIGSALE